MLFPDTEHPWRSRRLGELFELSLKGLNPANFPREEFHHYSIPAWDELGRPILELGKEIDSGKLYLEHACVLVSKLNPQIPRVRLFEPPADGRRACASTEIMPFVPRDSSARISFFKHYFLSDRFRKNLVSAATGTTNSHKRVRPPQTLQWLVPAPEPVEQAAIAHVLDAVDAAIDWARKAAKEAKELHRAMIQQFFYSALGVIAYADHPAQKLPAGWQLLPTEALLMEEPKNGVSPQATAQPPGVPTFSIAAIRDGKVDLSNASNLKYAKVSDRIAEKFRINTGDVLVVRGNANPDLVGKAGRVSDFPKGCIYPDITKRIVLRRGGEDAVLPDYAVLAWNHPIVHNQVLRRAKTSNGTLKINSRDVKQIVLPVPPKEVQEEIVSLVMAVDTKLIALNYKVGALQQLKKSLMHDLLTGAVRLKLALFKSETTA